MTITSVSLNGTSFSSSSEPVLNQGASTSNSFTIGGTGFSGSQVPSDISFGFTGYTPTASTITSQSTTQIVGTFYYNPSDSPVGGETPAPLAITVSGGGGSATYPVSGTYPVKIKA